MLANFEQRKYSDYNHVWIGRYQNLHNLAHWHLENEIIYVEKGDVLISHNDSEYLLTTGDLIFINSSQVHYIRSNQNCIVQIIMFDSSFLPEKLKSYSLKNNILKKSYSFIPTFSFIQQEQRAKGVFYIEKTQNALEYLLLEMYSKEELVQNGVMNKNDNILSYKKLLHEIQKHYMNITFSQAASVMGLSNSYFSRYFHKISGMTFSKYLNIIRIEKAIEMLKEEQSTITEISIQCGFDTIRHFNRVFKDITGMSPKQLPREFILYQYTTKVLLDHFDPTLEESILL